SSSDAGSSGGGTGRLMAAPGGHRIEPSASRIRELFMIFMWLRLTSMSFIVMQRAGAFVARRAHHAGCVLSPGPAGTLTMGVGSEELKLVGTQSQVISPSVLSVGVCPSLWVITPRML